MTLPVQPPLALSGWHHSVLGPLLNSVLNSLMP